MALERAVPGQDHWLLMHADHLQRYEYAARFVHGKRVLDAGTGPGYGAAILSNAGASEVIAVDIAADVIAEASLRYGDAKTKFIVDDCEVFGSVEGKMDVIVSLENIEHLQRPERFVKRSAELLNPDGVLLCSSPDTDAHYCGHGGRSANEFHVNEWSRAGFLDLLSQSFGEIELLSQVQSHALACRIEGVKRLHEHLTYLWSSPGLKIERAAHQLLGNRKEWTDIQSLSAGSPADYPIVPPRLLNAYGQAFCHFAICRKPLI